MKNNNKKITNQCRLPPRYSLDEFSKLCYTSIKRVLDGPCPKKKIFLSKIEKIRKSKCIFAFEMNLWNESFKRTFSFLRIGDDKDSSHILPNATKLYGSSWCSFSFNMYSNFFWAGAHSFLDKCKFPIRDQASACVWFTLIPSLNFFII